MLGNPKLALTALFDASPSRLLWMNVLPGSAPGWVRATAIKILGVCWWRMQVLMVPIRMLEISTRTKSTTESNSGAASFWLVSARTKYSWPGVFEIWTFVSNGHGLDEPKHVLPGLVATLDTLNSWNGLPLLQTPLAGLST